MKSVVASHQERNATVWSLKQSGTRILFASAIVLGNMQRELANQWFAGLTMGYISDFVRAPFRTAKEVVPVGNPRDRWDGIEAPAGLETMHLARLWCLATSISSEDQFDAAEEQLSANYSEDDEGAWGVVLPESFCDLLADLPVAERDRLGQDWSMSEEIAFDGIAPEDIKKFLPQLCDLCQRARSHSEQVILRVGE
jgi:hypothetical protein